MRRDDNSIAPVQVRFFTFLVGEEAKDFEQVKWMACNNRGFMAHITNMADVQEKVMVGGVLSTVY